MNEFRTNPIGPDAEFADLPTIEEAEPGFGEYLSAAVGNVLRDSPTSSLARMYETEQALEGTYFDYSGKRVAYTPDATLIPAEKAREMAKEAGVTVDFGEAAITPEAARLFIDRAKGRQARADVVRQYDPSMGTHLGVSLLASLADPLNIGAAFIPFAGEARYGALALEASATTRAAMRLRIGAQEGLAGAALVEPLIAGAALQEGQDYGIADALRNLAFGTAFGGGLHAVGGALGDSLFRRAARNAPPVDPADIIERIPEPINEAAWRASIADMIAGKPVSAMDVIDEFRRRDPEGARAIDIAQALKRDGPEIDETTARIGYWQARLSGKRYAPEGDDFAAWVRSKGGLRDDGGTLAAAIGGKVDLPSALYITAKGAKAAKRGVPFDEMLQAAIDEGFVRTREQFIDAFKANQRGTALRKVYRISEEEKLQDEAQLWREIKTVFDDAGLSRNASNTTRAKAIVDREQALLAEQKARSLTALDKLFKRQEEATAPPKIEPPKPFEPDPVTPPRQGAPEIGETVSVKDKGKVTSGKITKAYTDPVYGDYVEVEGIPYAVSVKNIEQQAAPAPAASGPSPAAKPIEGAPPLTRVPAAIGDKITAARRNLDALYPGLAEKKTYYLSSLFHDQMTSLEIGPDAMRKEINRMLKEKSLKAIDEETGKPLVELDSRYFGIDSRDNMPGVLLKFSKKTPAEAAPKAKKGEVKPLTEAEKAKAAEGMAKVGSKKEPVEIPPAPQRVVETPKADRDALEVSELDKATGQFVQLRAQNEKRLRAMLSQLPPDTAEAIKRQIADIDNDANKLEELYNTAVTCLLRPTK